MRPVSGFERPGLQWLFIGLGTALVVVAAGEGVALLRARTQMAALRAADLDARIEMDQLRARVAREQAAREALTLQLARQRGVGEGINQPTLTLSPLIKRGAQPPEATVAKLAGSRSILLRLVLPGRTGPAEARYSIMIRTWSGGETVWSRSGLPMTMVDSKAMVTAFITADVFAPGSYELSVSRLATDKPVEVAAYEVAIRP